MLSHNLKCLLVQADAASRHGPLQAFATTMQVSGICHFNLRAPRELLDSLRDFYCEVVGLSVGVRPAFSSFGYWLYAGSKDVLHLTEARPGEQRCTGRAATFDHVAFACTDAAAYRVRLQAAGIAFTTDTVPGTGQLQMFFTDPAGNGVELNFAGSANASVKAPV